MVLDNGMRNGFTKRLDELMEHVGRQQSIAIKNTFVKKPGENSQKQQYPANRLHPSPHGSSILRHGSGGSAVRYLIHICGAKEH